MLKTITIDGVAHPMLNKMYAISLYEAKYGSMAKLKDSINVTYDSDGKPIVNSVASEVTMTQLLYFPYCCICNGYFYMKQPVPFTFEEMLCNMSQEEMLHVLSTFDMDSDKETANMDSDKETEQKKTAKTKIKITQ